MIILYTGIILILYSIFTGELSNNYKLKIGFMFAFLIMAFQSNVEGDYMSYMEEFGSGDTRTIEDEPLWVYIQMPFYPLGWQVFYFFMASFQVWVVYRLAKLYAANKYQYLSAILFFFTFGMMLIQMKALRQGLAIEVCLLPFLLNVEKKKSLWQRLIVCYLPVIIAFFIHNSAIVGIIPATLLFLMHQKGWFTEQKSQKKREWFWPIVMASCFYVVYIMKQTLFAGFFTQLSTLLTLNDMRLGGYLAKEQEDGIFQLSQLLILYDAVMVFFATWLLRYVNGSIRVLCLMSIVSSFADTLFFGMGSLPRVGYFFTIANVAIIPCIANQINIRFGRKLALLFVVFCIGYAVKTSLPWMTGMEDDRFGNYRFVFM